MCGIAGFVTRFPLAPAAAARPLAAMVGALSHRGPDDSGTYIAGRAALGHARLSIIDLSPQGRQPMHGEDGTVHVILNGEIYNFQSLRAELGRCGHTFTSHTDTEVLVHGCEEWGVPALVRRLEGMFALALLDERRGRLWLARDRFGIKPLFYTQRDGGLWFASEMKALLAAAPAAPALDVEGLLFSLQHIGIPAPHTVFEGYRQLEPATLLEYDLSTGQAATTRHWQWRIAPEAADPAEAERQVWETLCRSVEKHLIADVPVGIFLSGGLDSSLVAAACAEIGRKPTCLTIAVDDPDYDESPFAAELCRHYGMPHQVERMDTARGRDYDPRLAGMFDEPFPASAALSTAYVAALAAPHFKVMLSGEGGDELFGGYGWYRRWTQFYGADGRAPSAWRHPRNAVRGCLGRKHLPADPMRGYATLMAAFSPREMRRLVRRDLLDRFPLAADAAAYYHTLDRPELAGFDRLQWLDLHHFLPTVCLTKMDRTSMAVSLEVRVPFLDHTVADLVGRLPAALRNPQNELKGLLRRVARSRLPEKLLGKPKQGFSTPIRDWFPAAEMLAAMRRDREAGDGWRAVFAPRALEAAAAYDGRRLWRLWHTWRWVNAHPAR